MTGDARPAVDGSQTGVAGSLPARTVVSITRWEGKPTSGRSVYRGKVSLSWWWQCDLHGDDEGPDDNWGGGYPSWQSAMAAALAHASVCLFVSASRVR